MRTCACCGKEVGLPGWCVPVAPKSKAILCEGCGARWVESPDAGLHDQLVGLGRWVEAVSQFQNFMALTRRVA